MSDMPNKEVLSFPDKGLENNKQILTSGNLALEPNPVLDETLEKQNRDAQIGIIKESIRPENILPFTNTDAGVQRAPRGVVGPVGNQGRETSGGDRTGGRRKKGLGFRITAGVMAVVAGAGIGYGVFKDKINSFFGGGVDPNDLPPTYPIETPGEMPSQSENIDSPTPSAEVTPEVTEAPTPTLDEFGFSEERRAELDQQIQDFLSYEGEYSKENIQKYLLPKKDKIYNLGLTSGSDSNIRVQAWLFDYIEKDGDLILLAGFDGKDGQRFVTALNIPLHFLNIKPNFGGVSFIKLLQWNYYSGEESDGYSANFGVVENHLLKSSPMLIDFATDIISDEEVKKSGGDDNSVIINQCFRNGLFYTNGLVSQIDKNGEGPFSTSNNKTKEIQKITKISDINKINNDEMPVINAILYVENK